MKYFFVTLLVCLFGCNYNSNKSESQSNSDDSNVVNIPEGAVEGDYNGDGHSEYMWLIAPKIVVESMDCEGECECLIQFSDPNILPIKVEMCIGGEPVNESDLNENGTDEIGLLPSWFTSCWMAYYVWTFSNGKWIHAVEPISTHCNQWEEGVKPIEKDPNHKGNVLIHYSLHADTSIVTQSKSVEIAK
ncbi:MAG: hypothetical protein R3E32_05735 [Chitinophagales bacterium]